MSDCVGCCDASSLAWHSKHLPCSQLACSVARSTSSPPSPSLWFLFPVHSALSALDRNLHKVLSCCCCPLALQAPAQQPSCVHSVPATAPCPAQGAWGTLWDQGCVHSVLGRQSKRNFSQHFLFHENHPQGFTELCVWACASRGTGRVFPL